LLGCADVEDGYTHSGNDRFGELSNLQLFFALQGEVLAGGNARNLAPGISQYPSWQFQKEELLGVSAWFSQCQY
jgi:hypothetical protein